MPLTKSSLIISLAYSIILLAAPAFASLEYLLQGDLTCHSVQKEGIGQQCCDGSLSPTTWGQDCYGDLVGDTPGGACEANEILQMNGFQNSYPINTGGICYHPGNCSVQNYIYNFACCPCPTGAKVYTGGQALPNCNTGAMCAYCSDPKETLLGQDDSNGYSCVIVSSTSVAKTTSKITSTLITTTTKALSTSKPTTSSKPTSSSASSSTSRALTTSKPITSSKATSTAKSSSSIKK